MVFWQPIQVWRLEQRQQKIFSPIDCLSSTVSPVKLQLPINASAKTNTSPRIRRNKIRVSFQNYENSTKRWVKSAGIVQLHGNDGKTRAFPPKSGCLVNFFNWSKNCLALLSDRNQIKTFSLMFYVLNSRCRYIMDGVPLALVRSENFDKATDMWSLWTLRMFFYPQIRSVELRPCFHALQISYSRLRDKVP